MQNILKKCIVLGTVGLLWGPVSAFAANDLCTNGLPSQLGYICTVIGGSNGDGFSANVAKIAPNGMVYDTNGNLYIADSTGQRIRRVDAQSGIITTIAGNGVSGFSGDGGQATAAKMSFPRGVAVDSSGNVYFTDTGNNRVRRIDKF